MFLLLCRRVPPGSHPTPGETRVRCGSLPVLFTRSDACVLAWRYRNWMTATQVMYTGRVDGDVASGGRGGCPPYVRVGGTHLASSKGLRRGCVRRTGQWPCLPSLDCSFHAVGGATMDWLQCIRQSDEDEHMRLEADDGRPETSTPLARSRSRADRAVVRERQSWRRSRSSTTSRIPAPLGPGHPQQYPRKRRQPHPEQNELTEPASATDS